MCLRNNVRFCSDFVRLVQRQKTLKKQNRAHIFDNMIKDHMVATEAPKEIFMIAIKEPLGTKGDLYDCNHRAPIVSLLIL